MEAADYLADQPVQLATGQKERKCVCGTKRKMDAREETFQRDFLRTYVRKGKFQAENRKWWCKKF